MLNYYKNNNSIRKVCDLYPIPFNFEQNTVIEVTSYNTNYFSSSYELINNYGLVILNYAQFCNNHKKEMRIMDFIKDSVNNSILNDSLSDVKFTIEYDYISFNLNGEKGQFINMGEFYIDNHKFNACSSYLFIEDLITGTQYFYYAD